VDVIYRGRPTDSYVPRRVGKQGIGVPGAEGRSPLILNVGRLVEGKGQAELVRALPCVVERHPGARLVIAGEGPFRGRLERLIGELSLAGRVFLAGTRSDIPELLGEADVFVSASRSEGLPGAVVEAMLTAVPVVLSDIGVHREMVEQDAAGGFFPPGDSGALADSICAVLSRPDQARAGASRARDRALELFDIRATAARHEALYAQVLAARSPRRSGARLP
jgi:glycosyltransferase involved in cell wall biosynthesis